jgi:hypothetical protein
MHFTSRGPGTSPSHRGGASGCMVLWAKAQSGSGRADDGDAFGATYLPGGIILRAPCSYATSARFWAEALP